MASAWLRARLHSAVSVSSVHMRPFRSAASPAQPRMEAARDAARHTATRAGRAPCRARSRASCGSRAAPL